jgi:hypothetical protein
MAQAATKKQDECKTAHGVRNEAFAACYKTHHEALKLWRLTIRPAIDTALVAAVAAIRIAEGAKAKVDWLQLLKPAVCALSRAMTAWGHLLGESWKAQVMAGVKLAEGVSCQK